MTKKGFTLAELLGVIIVIGLLALLIIPAVDRSIDNSKNRAYNAQIQSIQNIAEDWAMEHMGELPKNDGDSVTIYLWQLKIGGYIDDDLRDPRTGKLFPNDMEIIITRKNNSYVFSVVEGSGTEGNIDVPDVETPVITLVGDSTVYVEINGKYTELGATAKTFEGVDVTKDIVITGKVNVTKVGEYTIKYNVSYEGKSAKEVTRIVKVVDKTPVIVLNPNGSGYQPSVTIDVEVTPYGNNTITSLTYRSNGGPVQDVINNQIILNEDGKHILEVTAIDNEGNKNRIFSGDYNVDSTPPTITFLEGDKGVLLEPYDVADYDLSFGVTVTDNTGSDYEISGDLSAIDGEYYITYTAIDAANNVTTKIRKITVQTCTTTISMMGSNVVTCKTATNDPDGNIRFVGKNPNNYVEFNGELWRIIGVFDGQAKIVRNDKLSSNIVWNTSNSHDWSTASLQAYLNETYLESIQANDPTSYSYIDFLHVWNLGGTYNWSNSTRSDFYSAERGTDVYSGRPTTWTGAIGLMYPSDYGYSTSGDASICDSQYLYNWQDYSVCYNNSWLNSSHWTITPYNGSSYHVFNVVSNYVDEYTVGYVRFAPRPVLYLAPNVRIKSGSGTSDDPFKLYVQSIEIVEDYLLKNTDSSQLATNDPDGNLRYVGSDPDNYVWFNKDADGNPEKWRIIGVFNGQTKIIRDEYYSTSIAWDSNNSNNWETASLNAIFNDPNSGYIKTIQTNDATSYGYIDLDHVWNIGGVGYNIEDPHKRFNLYNSERGTIPAAASGATATWTGAIGLMYPSDYGYSTSGDSTICDVSMLNWVVSNSDYRTCYSNSWLPDIRYDQATLTSRNDNSMMLIVVEGNGSISDGHWASTSFAVRPVLFLNENVGIIDGTGSSEDPFVLTQ